MRTVQGLECGLIVVLVMMGCGGGGSGGDSGGPEVRPETESEIVAEAIEIAIDRTIADCPIESTGLLCLDASVQSRPLLSDNDTVEGVGCGWHCLPVPTRDGGEQYVMLHLIWQRFVDQCYDPESAVVIFAFVNPSLCTPNF